MFISSFLLEIRWPRRWARYICFACAFVVVLIGGGIARAYLARRSPPPPLRFNTKGWEYRQIVPAMAADGRSRRLERYRLRVDVARASVARPCPGKTPAGTPGAEATKARGPGGPDHGARPPSSERAKGSEFRVLLERRDESDFVCLRWLDGELALLKFAGGGRARLLGRTSYFFPRLVRDAATASFHIDRSPGLWAVSSFGRELITAGDPGVPARDAEGKEKAPDFAWGATPEWTLAARAFQPIEPIHFEDEFAREDFNGNGSYEIMSGAWQLDAAKDVGRSVNTFRLRGASAKTPDGRAEPAVAVLGSPFWRGYRVEASIRFSDAGSGGLVFAATLAEKPKERKPPAHGRPSPDARASRFGILRWRLPGPPGKAEDAKGANVPSAPSLEVVEVERRPSVAAGAGRGWDEHVVFSLPWTPRRDQWYRVAVSLFAELGELEVNGRRQVFPLPSRLRAGACGLYSDSREGVLFDDVRVASHGGFLFRAGGAVAPWAGSPGGKMDIYRLPAGPAWLRLRLGKGTPAARLGWSERPGGMVSLVLDRDRLRGQIFRTRPADPGAAPVHVAEFGLGRQPASARRRQGSACAPCEFTVEIDRRECSVLRGRTVLARASLRSARDGPVYLEPCAAGGPRLPHLAGGPLPPRRALRRKSRAFTKVDITMRNGEKLPKHKWIQFLGWLEDRGTWERGTVGRDQAGPANEFLRCRTFLWGPVEASARPDLPRKPGRSVMLALVPDEHDLAPIGVGARCEPGGERVLVDIRGRRIAGIPKRKGQKVQLELRRSGDFVEASADGKLLCRAPLRSDAPVRVETRGGVSPDDVTIRASSVGESLFESAPVEWVRWRGRWDVTSKWQCDPRWTFLGLWSDRIDVKSEAAGVFTRAYYSGDQDLQFYFTFKDVFGGAGDRRYIRRDVNFAFACAGEDLASGYCLLLGGFDNRGTQLLRRGKVVHENRSFRLPDFAGSSGDIHWKWYRMRVLKRGGTIRAALNGKEVLSWRDPHPLDGGHVGVWTIGNGIILGRTRFSSAGCGEELAGFSAEAPGTSVAAGWLPLDPDRPVRITAAGVRSMKRAAKEFERAGQGLGMIPLRAVRVTNVAGGGHFAVARAGSSDEPKTRAFAFRARAGVRVGAYAVKASSLSRVRINGVRPRRIAVAGEGALPADGAWHVFSINGALRRDETLVFGSWEPKDYVVAGIGANAAGASYEVGVFDSAEKVARRKAEEGSRRKAEEEARRRTEQEARRKAEVARRKAKEEARRRTEQEARRKAEVARRKAEEEARRQAEEETRRKAEVARRKAKEDARRQAEEEARRKAEVARRKAEEGKRRQAEEEAQRKAEVARREAEKETRRRAEEAQAFLSVKTFPPNPRRQPDGLEGGHEWKAVDWGNAVEVSAWKRPRAGEDVLLLVSSLCARSPVPILPRAGEDVLLLARFAEGKRDKAAIKVDVGLELAREGSLRMDVYNATAHKIPVAFAVFASDDRVYSESRTRPAKPGWNHLKWDLAASTYKTLASGWKHTSQLQRREDVRELALLFYEKKSAALALDGIEVDVRPGR